MKKRKQYNKKNQRSVGARYEQIAGKYLEQQGYQILQYNYHCRQGEIDIIARDGEYLVFCEVKYRTDRRKRHAVGSGSYKKTAGHFQMCTILHDGKWCVGMSLQI